MTSPSATQHDVPSPAPGAGLAVVGVGCLFPGEANSFSAYWGSIRGKVDAVRPVPASHWRAEDYLDPDPKKADHVYQARGAFLEPLRFHPADFGIAPNDIEATDTAQLLGLVAARQALIDAGYALPGGPEGLRPLDRRRVSVILGVTGTLELVIPLGARLGHPIWRRALAEAGVAADVADDVVARIAAAYVPWQENSFPGLLGNVVAGRIANRLDLGGTNCVVDAACASSLGALHLAALELSAGRADIVLTGGIDTFNDIFMFTCFSKTPALSPSGDARPFDGQGDGTILGEGLGVVVLKRLDDARRDGDRIYAVLRGVGSSSDGKGNAIYAPRAEGQREALRAAYADAGISPATVELVEAHGTGTRVGDATELKALIEVYQASGREGTWCALGSVKSQIGHTKAAAGAAGLIKAVAALHHKVLPPSLKVQRPLEALEPGASPFYLNAEPRPWLSAGHPRRAAVSAFGFGGSNFHCVLEEAGPARQEADWDRDVQLLAFQADSRAALGAKLRSWAADLPWDRFCLEAHATRRAWSPTAACRLLLVVERSTDLPRLLGRAGQLLEGQAGKRFWHSPEGIHFGEGQPPGRLAVLFPGQGAQYPGMLRDLVCQLPEAFACLDRAAAVFAREQPDAPSLGELIYPLHGFTPEQRQAAEAALRATWAAQPALGAVALGAWRALQALGLRASAFAGHSYGELAALCAAGRLDEDTFLRLSCLRGRLMARGNAAGGMLAVAAPAEDLLALLTRAGLALTLANRNAPLQNVLSGPAEEIGRAEQLLRDQGVRCQQLAVGGAFHSPLVADAQGPFRSALDEAPLPPGDVPVYANSTASPYPEEAAAARDLLGGQLARPVDFVAQVRRMLADGLTSFLEVGPGARLTGLVQAIAPEADAFALDASAGRKKGLADLASCLAWAAVRGQDVRLDQWCPAEQAPAAGERNGKRPLEIELCGANHVKPRPPRPRRAPAPERSAPVSPPPASRETPPDMNGSQRQTDRPDPAPTAVPARAPAAAPAAAPAVDTSALTQALQLTRESLAALQQMQQQTAQLHRQFLEGQDSTQNTVHLLVEQQRRLVEAALTGTVAASPLPPLAEPGARVERPAPPAPRISAPAAPAPLPAPVSPPAPVLAPPPVRAAEPVRAAAAVAAVPAPPLPASPAPAVPSGKVEQVLLEAVAEKTGYPVEMLELDMALDADLGIDSIKRVEILSTLQDRLPDAPVVKPEHLGSLHTLRSVAAFLSGGQAPQGTNGHAPAAPPAPAAVPGSGEVEQVLLEAVAEKTGYPVEMLELDMALDADLGIDSIKRVEILSTLQDRLPDAPVVKPEHLGSLHTLRSVAAFLSGKAQEAVGQDVGGPPRPFVPSGGHLSSASTAEHLEPASPACQDAGEASPSGKLPEGVSLRRQVVTRVALAPSGQRRKVALAAGAEIWIVGEDRQLSRLLAEGLSGQGLRARSLSWEEAGRLDRPASLAGLVVLAAPGAGDDLLERSLFAVQRLGPSLRQAGKEGGALLATVSRLDGAFGLGGLAATDPEPVAGGLAGLAKTAAREWCEVSSKAIDLAPGLPPVEAAAALAAELLATGPLEVGLAHGQTWTLDLVEEPARAGGTPLRAGDVVVVTGGARGVTAEAAVALARSYRPTLILLGRSELPDQLPAWLADLSDELAITRELARREGGRLSLRELGEASARLLAQREGLRTLARIEEAGARAFYHAVDVRDARAVADCLREVRARHGEVRGIVHGAGVLADALIEDKTPEQLRRVYATKVEGLRALLAAVDPGALRVLALFSSTTARLGRRGQVDYAMANEVLNKLAQHFSRRHPTCRVVSVGWGPWAGGMVTPALAKLFEQEGVGLIPPAEGAAWLAREVAQPAPGPVEVVALAGTPEVATAAPRPAPAAMSLAFERRLDLQTCRVLEAHVLDGRPVLPVALALELLAQGAMHQNPGLLLHGCDDLRVLRGVIFDEGALTLRVLVGKATRGEGLHRVPVELRSLDGAGDETTHVRAAVLLAGSLPPAPVPTPLPALGPWHRPLPDCYGGWLFHGPDLQGIERVEGAGADGIVGVVRAAPPPPEWLQSPLRHRWLTDPLVLDASFQLMILWTWQQRGSGSLPCRLASYRQYSRSFPTTSARVVVHVTRATDLAAVADIDYLDDAGRLLARLEGYECVLDPGLERAFRANTLSPTLSYP